MKYVISCLIAFIIMFFLTPILRKIALKFDYVEKPIDGNERKIHKEAKPYLAGVGIFFSFWVVYAIFVWNSQSHSLLIFFSSLLIFLIGMVDDWYKIKGYDFKVLPKMIVQLFACVLVYNSGIMITGFSNPFSKSLVILPVWLQFFLTVIWLFGITTVINFTDGLDGLAGGLTCISAATLFLVAIAKGQIISGTMSIILVGICLGYLRYNKFPARILMGDAGATFLGFMLGVISIDGAFKQTTIISIVIPVFVLGLPIFDNIFVVFKRAKKGKPIYVADASQIHFRLLAKGLTQKQAVYFLYLISLCMNLGAIIILLLKV